MRKLLDAEKNEYARIEVKYALGGTNYFSGKNEQRGLYVHFDTVEIGDHFIKSTPMSNNSFKIFFKPLKRKSAKQLQIAEEWLSDNQLMLFKLYEKLDKQALLDLVQSAHKTLKVAA